MKIQVGDQVWLRHYNYPLEVTSVTRTRITAKYNNFHVNAPATAVIETLPNPKKEEICGANSQLSNVR